MAIAKNSRRIRALLPDPQRLLQSVCRWRPAPVAVTGEHADLEPDHGLGAGQVPRRVLSAGRSRFGEPVTGRILGFIAGIGIETAVRRLAGDTFLPGIQIEAGRICVDPGRLLHPGDLLHEAGHLAVLPPKARAACTGAIDHAPADEMMAIAWSWAALTHLELPPSEVFHASGYKGDSEWLIETYRHGSYIGLPMLQWIGLAADARQAERLGVDPYPHMLRWLRA